MDRRRLRIEYGGEPLWGVSDDLATFGPGLDVTKDEENRRLPRITQRHVLSIVSIGLERKAAELQAMGNSREPPAAIRQSCHTIKRLPSRRWTNSARIEDDDENGDDSVSRNALACAKGLV